MNFSFENVDKPAAKRSSKYLPIVERVRDSETGQWIKVSGFEKVYQLKNAKAAITGPNGAMSHIVKDGFMIECEICRADLVLYVRKVEVKR